MIPIDFLGSNIELVKPADMTDEQCASMRAYKEISEDGFTRFLTVWQPNKEDIDAIAKGRPICLVITSAVFPPVHLYTVDDQGESNAG
jgi:hypothetical protein